MTTRFNNPASSKSHYVCSIGKEPYKHLDDSGQNMQGKYVKYTLLMVSREMIYQVCVNTKFWKVRIQTPYLVRETSQAERSKYCWFHKINDHNTYDCIQIKDAIEDLIKRGD